MESKMKDKSELLSVAKDAIASSDKSFADGNDKLRIAAEALAELDLQSVSQQEITDDINKSKAWVCALLKWRDKGYPDRAKAGAGQFGQGEIVPERDRDLLVKILGMLGSDQDGECLNAARKSEAQRKKLGLTWNDLIVPAQLSYAQAAETPTQLISTD
jgi:hypothetical protein